MNTHVYVYAHEYIHLTVLTMKTYVIIINECINIVNYNFKYISLCSANNFDSLNNLNRIRLNLVLGYLRNKKIHSYLIDLHLTTNCGYP